MHEASLVEGLLKYALGAVQEYNAKHPDQPQARISRLICEAGLLAGFENQTLKACFEIFTENTLAEGAELIINTAPLACSCKNCGEQFQLIERKFICPKCGNSDILFKGGNGLILQAINVEQDKSQ